MKKNLNSMLVVAFLVILLSTGCAERKNLSPLPSISPEAKASMDKPVNCSTAYRDIKVLEDEKVSVGKQILAGVRSVVPFSAAAGILLGDYRDRVSVATGRYNDDLADKIDEIKTRCKIR